MDPEVISQILARRSRVTPLAGLTPREREAPALMAEGRTNVAIARSLVITTKAGANTSRAFSPSSTCRHPTTITAGCSRSSRT